MAANALGAQQKAVEELFFQNDAVSLRLLVNRRAHVMRVIDFRAGATEGKRLFVLSLARREGIEKVYTVVERDEVATWVKLGLAKEGSIPGFYKRSDAFLLGCPVGPASERDVQVDSGADETLTQSETRLTVARPDLPRSGLTEAQSRMERTILAAKKALKKGATKATGAAKVTLVPEGGARKAVATALRAGRALTAFEPFGRDVERRYFLVTVRGGFELYASTESQACFGNAYLELLQGPCTQAEEAATTAALKGLCDLLLSEGVVSCFSLAPSDDVPLAAAFLCNGFRRTGLLGTHLLVGGRRRDAILWSRRLANPSDE